MGEKDQYLKQGFTVLQIEEIEQGLEAGIDVSVYAKKGLFAIQMRQIRLGLTEGLPVEVYAKPEYDWFQMEEIRKGLLAKVDIKKYASSQISYESMRQIRKGLMQGIDLSPYQRLDANILRQLRKSMLSKVNILDYIKQGYQEEQLEQIRLALEKGIDIRPYLSKEFRGASIHEICEGLEGNLDVAAYAKVEYNWRQMREIRLGMEHRIDIWKYTDSLYDWRQMREIRLGLENGLNVDNYRSLMYTYREMALRRKKLQEDTRPRLIGEERKPEIDDVAGDFHITVSRDDMEAFIQVVKERPSWKTQDIRNLLESKGIFEGILETGIERIARGKAGRQKIMVAKGKKPIDGKDGWYEYFFEIKPERKPRMLEDGSVDYQNTDWIEMVTSGQKLAYYHEAESGVPGYTVFGTKLEAKRGRERQVLKGKGFILLPDQKTYLASEDGRITFIDGRMEISKLLLLDDVTLATGNVEFNGNLYVKGNVGSGTKLIATGDIQVNGFVESAVIEAGGNILLKQGVNASRTGHIRAGKNVSGQFFETANIYAGGDIQVNYCLNSELHAEGSIMVTGAKGTLAGGTAYALRGLTAYNLGNRTGIMTRVRLGANEAAMRKKQQIEAQCNSVNEELNILGKAYCDFQRKYPPEVRNAMEIYLKVENAIYTKEKQMESLMQAKERVEEELEWMTKAKAVVNGLLHEGVIMEISGVRWHSVSEVRDVTVKWIDDRIALFHNR